MAQRRLYLENKYGADTLKKREKADRVTVLKFEKRRLTPVVDTAVKDNYMQLLNANSYQKGGWVLHMLRRKLGDDLFWKGIRNYYAQYNSANANTDDLRRVMEEASGQNLEQFFKQWLYTAGHPQLNISWKYDADKGVINISINQNQEVLYDCSLQIAVNGQLHSIAIKDKNTTVQFEATANPVVVVDPDVNLLAEFNVNQ